MNLFRHDMQEEARERVLSRLEHEGLNFERWLITLATGTLVLSVTFIDNVVPDPGFKTLLVCSWVALVLSILFGLVDRLLFIFSLSSHPLLGHPEDSDERERRWMRYWVWSERMSWLQITTFFLGILLLLIFAINEL